MNKPDAPTRIRQEAKRWRDEEIIKLRERDDHAARECRLRASTLEGMADILADERVNT